MAERLFIAALGCVLALGCAVENVVPGKFVPGASGRLEKRLQETAERYADNLRWGRVGVAVKLVEPELRPAFLALFDDEHGALRLTDMEVASVETGPEPEQGTVHMKVRMYRSHALTEETLVEQQRWRFDRSRDDWLVVPDLALYEAKP
jgi:hypothetical protein